MEIEMRHESKHDDNKAYMRAKGWSDATFLRSNAALERLHLAVRRLFFPPDGEAIEIGFGSGALLDFLKRSGYSVRGYEISSPLIELARTKGFEAHDVIEFLSRVRVERLADLIVAFDVFEHMDDETVMETLQAAARHLSPSGIIVIRTPNAASPLGLYYQCSDWTHRNHWSTPYAAYCAERSGLALVRVVGEFDFAAAQGFIGVIFLIRNVLYKLLEFILRFSVYRSGGFRIDPNLYFILGRVDKVDSHIT